MTEHPGADLHARACRTAEFGAGQLTIRDDGRGIAREELRNPLSFGLVGIRERVLTLGGRIRIWGARNRGTVVVTWIPLVRREGNNHEEDTHRR